MRCASARAGRAARLDGAGVTLAGIPIIALYLVIQRHFIQGMIAGALK